MSNSRTELRTWEVTIAFVGGDRTTYEIVEAADEPTARRKARDERVESNAIATEAYEVTA
jgi:hypothetical protein